MELKKIFLSGCISLGMLFSASALASDLTITNDTNFNSTSRINNGKCSTEVLGEEAGTTKAHTTKVIKEYQVNFACIANSENCKADVYMANRCKGEVVARVIFSTKTGIKKADILKAGFSIAYTPFSIRLTSVK